MINKTAHAAVLISAFTFLSPAHAILFDNGDGTITDTDTNLMWLKDMNLTNTESYDDNLYGFDTNGALLWSDAIDWADSLDFANHTDWRLPTADATCVDPHDPDVLVFNCTQSELGALYYNSLGNVAMDPTPNFTPFENAPTYMQFWTGTEYDATHAFDFHLSDGGQHTYTKDEVGPFWGSYTNVIAVREITTTGHAPAPSALLLMLPGLAGLLVYTRKKKSV